MPAEMLFEMLGLGPIMKTLYDPNFQRQLQQFLLAMSETLERTRRIEARLDELEVYLRVGDRQVS
jgi:hypothetical protein